MKRKLWSHVRRDSSQKLCEADIFQMALVLAAIFTLAIAAPTVIRLLFNLFS